MSREDAQQVHCETVVPYFECGTAVLTYVCLATMWHIGTLCTRSGAVLAHSPALGGGRDTGNPHANMPQEARDDLRVVDQRHGAYLVLTLGCHRDTGAD